MKRTLAMMLAMIMLFSIVPLTAYAEEADIAQEAAQEELAETGGAAPRWRSKGICRTRGSV